MGLKDNYFLFNGFSSRDANLYVTGYGIYSMPVRDISKYTIDGKDGDLIVDNGRYKNNEIYYKCLIVGDLADRYQKIKDIITSTHGYARLEDSFNPEFYRMAYCNGGLEPKIKGDYEGASFKLTFDCKPQLYYKSGEHAIIFEDYGKLHNPTTCIATPLVRVYGVGTVSIGNDTIEILENDNYIDIDCDLKDAYCGNVNCNPKIKLLSGEFFKLITGENGVSLGSGITKVEITPRFYTI